MTPYQEVPVASVLGRSWVRPWRGPAKMGPQRVSGMSPLPMPCVQPEMLSLCSPAASGAQLKPLLLDSRVFPIPWLY